VHELFHHFHVTFRPVAFAELPYIDNVAVKDDCFGVDAFEVLKKFFCMAAVGAEMYIREDEYVDFSFFVFHGVINKYEKSVWP